MKRMLTNNCVIWTAFNKTYEDRYSAATPLPQAQVLRAIASQTRLLEAEAGIGKSGVTSKPSVNQ